ncbi:MAG: hypothetical protein ACLRIS_21295 [Flavonifractor plautii]
MYPGRRTDGGAAAGVDPADNRLAELAEWDRQALRWSPGPQRPGFDLELTASRGAALPPGREPPAAEEDAEAPVQGWAPLESGRCYQLGRHRLYVGDAPRRSGCAGTERSGRPTDPPTMLTCTVRPSPGAGRTLRVLNDHWESEDAFEDFLAGALAGCAGHMEPGAASTCGMPPCTRSAPTMPAPGAGWGCASS